MNRPNYDNDYPFRFFILTCLVLLLVVIALASIDPEATNDRGPDGIPPHSRIHEFVLEDGTRCVALDATSHGTGLSCDWGGR